MRDAFEKFAQMEFETWLSLMALAICATIITFAVERTMPTWQEFLSRSFMTSFAGYLAALYCMASDINGRMQNVIVGFVTYQATNILTGIGKLGAAFAKDPLALLEKIRKAGRK